MVIQKKFSYSPEPRVKLAQSDQLVPRVIKVLREEMATLEAQDRTVRTVFGGRMDLL